MIFARTDHQIGPRFGELDRFNTIAPRGSDI